MRKLSETTGSDGRVIAVFRDSENNEYQVRIKPAGERAWREAATYFTDDRADAFGTANTMLVE